MNGGSAPTGLGLLVAERVAPDAIKLIDLTQTDPHVDELAEPSVFRSSRMVAVLVGLGGLAAVLTVGVLVGVISVPTLPFMRYRRTAR
jgi:hypothetical protein